MNVAYSRFYYKQGGNAIAGKQELMPELSMKSVNMQRSTQYARSIFDAEFQHTFSGKTRQTQRASRLSNGTHRSRPEREGAAQEPRSLASVGMRKRNGSFVTGLSPCPSSASPLDRRKGLATLE